MERLGIVSYSNVAPLHWQLEPWQGCQFVRGVPSELNAMLLAGDIDLTLISSVEFLRHRDKLKALPDFSISNLGAVQSVLLFHWQPWQELQHARIALTNHSATSITLLQFLLAEEGFNPSYSTVVPNLTSMLEHYDAALLIGDAALSALYKPPMLAGKRPFITDLGVKWYEKTTLPFTFAVWATRDDAPPSTQMVQKLREARVRGVGNLQAIAQQEAPKLAVSADFLQRYLHNFRYYLEQPDRDGLVLFASRILETEDFDASSLRFWDC